MAIRRFGTFWAVFLCVVAFLGPVRAETVDSAGPDASGRDVASGELVIYVVDETGALRGLARRDPRLAALLDAAPDADARAEARLRLAAAAVISGPTPQERQAGYRPALPIGSALDEVRVQNDQGGFFITLPSDYLQDFNAEKAQFFSDLFRKLDLNVPRIRRHVLMIRDPKDGRHHPLPHFLRKTPPSTPKPNEDSARPPRRAGQPPAPGQGQPIGFLTGKSIFVNPGHGWYYNSGLDRWSTQRGITHGMIEDHSNAEAVDTYLIHYLWNAGAGVYSCRERDFNDRVVIVDNEDPQFDSTGNWVLDSSSGYGGNSLRVTAAATETATATFTPVIAESGYYHVSLWYEGGTLNAADVDITVRHAGGETVWTQNQQRDGHTWKYIGRYYFHAGSSLSTGSVTISNASSDTGLDVVADAVRFGGGTGGETPFGEPLASGFPRWEEAGPYHASYMGCATNCGSSTVSAMPQYAKWESEAWEDSIYVSWHSNAASTTSRGTSSFAYASGGWDAPFDGVPGGLELRDFVHAELMNDLRVARDPTWTDRGLHTSWFGELNPVYNDEMPAALFEMAFHDNAADADHLKDPTFRQTVARAVYQGIVRYFADRDGETEYYLLPEPPTHLRVTNDGSGAVSIAWNAPPNDSGDGLLGDPASAYRVYRSPDGLGFDDGIVVDGGATTGYVDALVVPGSTYYYRMTATNAGGESFPTETLAVRVISGAPRALVVASFDRMDRFLSVATTDPQSGGTVLRGDVERMNSYRYATKYAGAIDAYGVAFDSCSNEAVIDGHGQVDLSGYHAVIWFCGEESTADQTFDPSEQGLVQAYLDGGGNLLVSGTDIGWELDDRGNGVAFYNDYLMADYLQDDAGTYDVDAVAGGIFAGNASFSFDDGTHGEYDAQYADVLDTSGGSAECLAYPGVVGGHAGVQYDGATYKVVNLGFPFETVTSEAARNEIMADVLGFFGVNPPAPPPVPDGVFGSPLMARRTGPQGTSVELTWDAALCPAAGYHLIYGSLDTVATYAVGGSLCDLSPSGSDTWSNVPAGDLWYLVLGNDGAQKEGSWGETSAGSRNPAAPSGQCAIVTRDDSGVCD